MTTFPPVIYLDDCASLPAAYRYVAIYARGTGDPPEIMRLRLLYDLCDHRSAHHYDSFGHVCFNESWAKPTGGYFFVALRGLSALRETYTLAGLASLPKESELPTNAPDASTDSRCPIVEVETKHSADEANALLAAGWVLLTLVAHHNDRPDFHVGRPAHVPETVR